MRQIGGFLMGIFVGIVPLVWQNLPQESIAATLEEEVIAQVMYQDVTTFLKEGGRWDAIKHNIEAFVKGERQLLPEKELYEVGSNLSIKWSERFAQEVSVLTGCNTRRGKAGRPFKQTGEPMRDAILQNKQ